MNRFRIAPVFLLLAIAGCGAEPAAQPRSTSTIQRPDEVYIPPSKPARPPASISWDTERDHKFAEFLREKSGGMIRDAAVGIERENSIRIKLDRSVVPDETLSLTKSVMAGARNDFPDQPVTLSVYDPSGQPVLKARYKPGQGIKYQIAHEAGQSYEGVPKAPATVKSKDSSDPVERSGMTDADRKFASWAEDHGKSYLRYVEADLEQHGRLWFGVAREVKPADVPALTKSLLEGARKQFPRGILVANVFDPEGERIGRAYLENDGNIRWQQ